MPWRDQLRPASFRGVRFHVDATSLAGGRRGQTYEFPKSDRIQDEDLGRRVSRWAVTGYVIGQDYDVQAAQLAEALRTPGPGLLIHPVMGEMDVRCDTYTWSERRTEGGIATFDMAFVEAPRSNAAPAQDTAQGVKDAAYAANVQTIGTMNASMNDGSIKAGPR